MQGEVSKDVGRSIQPENWVVIVYQTEGLKVAWKTPCFNLKAKYLVVKNTADQKIDSVTIV